jgi:signal transduction histidine kinase
VTAADADVATVVVGHGTDEVTVAAATGVQASEVIGRTADMDESPAGRVIRTGKAVLVTEYRTAADPLAMGGDIGPMMLVPLTAGERAYGALALGRVAGREGFTHADLGMAASFATQAAVALALADARDTELRVARLEDHDRIAFDLHDHVIGELFALGIGLQRLAGVTDTPTRVARINGYIDSLDRVVGTIRTTIFQLQPHDPTGLQARVLHIADTHTEQLGYPPHLRFAGPIDLVVDEPPGRRRPGRHP